MLALWQMWTGFKILSPADSWEHSLRTYTKTSISAAICCYV